MWFLSALSFLYRRLRSLFARLVISLRLLTIDSIFASCWEHANFLIIISHVVKNWRLMMGWVQEFKLDWWHLWWTLFFRQKCFRSYDFDISKIKASQANHIIGLWLGLDWFRCFWYLVSHYRIHSIPLVSALFLILLVIVELFWSCSFLLNTTRGLVGWLCSFGS